jgi:hypothetical protein
MSGRTSIGFPKTTITTFNGTGNNVELFDLQLVTGLTNIYIIDDPFLLYVVWPTTPILNNFTLSTNPLLNQSQGWETQNISNLVLTGSFSDAVV